MCKINFPKSLKNFIKICKKKWNVNAQSIDWARELKWGRAIGDIYDSFSPWSIKDRLIKKIMLTQKKMNG